ncbi:CYTH domain-containing protein [Pseudobutyrivibrio xylanivorans]|uniref:CYTH domain-containing protein n=1 Tax=Pseudobutyrivibrio xylanivorans TaxID=185007 RepID=A0A5P6VTU5_PSEXY|nr:CYTH domain-containing protein [Pseudobutyrivibrio xylanivorans]QFJ54634.1 CYTH domain-containing protein [Pseudobutyrivibrio xylanivorans]
MEIERKFLIKELPDLSKYNYVDIEQGYLSTQPVVRIRKKNDAYILTYKGGGLMAREEIEAALTKEAYEHLREKIDGYPITKRRYLIPLDKYTIELDVFEGHMEGLIMAEVEFSSIEEANSFVAPDWFGQDVTEDPRYHNSRMIFGNPLS